MGTDKEVEFKKSLALKLTIFTNNYNNLPKIHWIIQNYR
jgi:hypothetical protein